MKSYKYLCIITVAISYILGCQSVYTNDTLSFNPVPNKDYQFSFTKTTVKQWTYNNEDHSVFDTADINFTLQNIKSSDSSHTCRLIFNEYKLKRPPFKATFINTGSFKPVNITNPFAILDSLTYYLHDIPLFVEINRKGIVEGVNGIDELIANVSSNSHTDKASVKRLLLDYVSTNAIKDLLNRPFSIPPNRKVINGDRLVSNILLVTKAPVKISNDYIFKTGEGDSLTVDIASILSSVHDIGDPVYLNGTQKGYSIMNYSTGIPYSYEINSETVTKTNFYDVTEREHIKLKQLATK